MNASSSTPLARHGAIDARDIELVHRTDSVDDAYEWIVQQLAEKALVQPGARCRENAEVGSTGGRCNEHNE